MKKHKMILFVFAVFLFCGLNKTTSAVMKSSVLPLKCVAGVVIDQNSLRVLYSKNGDRVLPMASTTKIITAIVAIESGKLNKHVTVSQRAASINGSSAGLKKGENISVEELIYGLLLRSGNDAAIALAEAVSGSVEGFVEKMNDKAIELGLYNTSFTSPHGLDNDEHHTTAEELAKVTAYAMRNNIFAKVAATKSIEGGQFGHFNRSYSNINKFLFRRQDADGVKTGYTGNAGKCLVASVKSTGGRFIAVVFNSNDRWHDADKLVSYAENNYKYKKIYNKGIVKKSIKLGVKNSKTIYAQTREDFIIPILKDGSEKPKIEYFTPSTLLVPTAKNEIIGNITVLINNKIISCLPVYCSNKNNSNE